MSKLIRMREGGRIHGRIRQQLFEATQIGSTPAALESLCQRLITAAGAKPSFPTVPGYHWATCININDSCVHGIPTSTIPFNPGDVVTVDLGVYYRGYHLDGAFTKLLPPASAAGTRLVAGGLAALEATLAVVRAGRRVGDLSAATARTLREYQLSPFRELTGHGVGRVLHEDPMLPNLPLSPPSQTPQLVVGQTLAIEIICTTGAPSLLTASDGWTIKTKDGKLSGVFEETVEVTSDGYSVLTQPRLSQINNSGKIDNH